MKRWRRIEETIKNKSLGAKMQRGLWKMHKPYQLSLDVDHTMQL